MNGWSTFAAFFVTIVSLEYEHNKRAWLTKDFQVSNSVIRFIFLKSNFLITLALLLDLINSFLRFVDLI